MDKYFFEIPVFRCSREAYLEELELEVKRLIEFYKKPREFPGYDYESLARGSVKGPGYRYGEMVGVIRLYVMSLNQIRGEYFFVDQRVSRRLKSKTWSYLGKLFEIWVRTGDTNATLYQRILERIESTQRESRTLSKRYIDTECFIINGKYLDFLSLLNNESTHEG